ncbi:hypothetical protein D3C75_1300210 [compost metagenome]
MALPGEQVVGMRQFRQPEPGPVAGVIVMRDVGDNMKDATVHQIRLWLIFRFPIRA